MCIGMLSSPKIGGRMSNSEFGIQSWMMIKMTKRSKYWKRNKVKGQKRDEREKKESLVRMKINVSTKSTASYEW